MSVRSYVRYRYCHQCQQVKPPRTHHCSICDACVRRMDHHCPWMGNCIGILNHKYFWDFLLWAFLGTLQVTIAILAHKGFLGLGTDTTLMVACVMSFAFSVSIGALFAVHSYLIAFNMSTLESVALNDQNPFRIRDGNWRTRVIANVEMNFGRDPWWRWLLPLEPKMRLYDGTEVMLEVDGASGSTMGSDHSADEAV